MSLILYSKTDIVRNVPKNGLLKGSVQNIILLISKILAKLVLINPLSFCSQFTSPYEVLLVITRFYGLSVRISFDFDI